VDDHTLVRKAAQGDELAFEVLVRRHTESVWRLARSLLRDDFAAEEAVQDTFLKAHRALAGFRGEAAVTTWLLAICHRCCIDRLRRRRAEVVPIEHLRERRAREDTAELRLSLQAALETLSPNDRQAFTLVDVLGYSREEAAAITGMPASTMRTRVARARARLLDALTTDTDAENGS
jgi:RNA polymerase sigma-70 factor (ECF subfamily)